MNTNDLTNLTLPDLCMRLRMACNNPEERPLLAGEEWDVPTMRKVQGYLERRLRTWREGSPSTLVFDEAVRSLIAATLIETAPKITNRSAAVIDPDPVNPSMATAEDAIQFMRKRAAAFAEHGHPETSLVIHGIVGDMELAQREDTKRRTR